MRQSYLTTLLLLVFSCDCFSSDALQNFFSSPDMISAKLSPDGKHTATLNDSDSGQRVNLVVNETVKSSVVFDVNDFSQFDASIRNINWIDSRHIAVQFSESRKGIKDLLDTKIIRHLLLIQLPITPDGSANILSVKTKGWLVDPMTGEDNVFLYAKSGPHSKVYRIDALKLALHKAKSSKLMKRDGGQFVKSNEVASVAGYAIRWFVSSSGKVIAALNYINDGDLQLSALTDDGKVTPLTSWSKALLNGDKENETEKLLVPIAVASNNESFYCLDIWEDEERTVYKVNYKRDEEERIFAAESYKIVELILSDDNELNGVTVINNGAIENIYLNKGYRKLEVKPSSSKNKELSTLVSNGEDYRILYKENHDQPGHYLLINNAQETSHLGSVYPLLVDQLNTKLIENSVLVEKLNIPYLLTLPKTTAKPLPLIVMPHGGPIGVYDQPYFDQVTQYLAANGYGVLRVNFRGSSGYSEELQNAGKMQWGNLMLEDIYQATLAVSKRKDIDESKICVFGMSYGGYASTMLTIKHPELFQCAVNVAGVSDVNLYLNKHVFTDRSDSWAKEHIGDTTSNYDELKSISPIYSIKKLSRPILIIHGEKDTVVNVEHAYRLKAMLDKHGKVYDWHIFPELKHNFSRSSEAKVLFQKVVNYIDKQLK